MKFMAHQQKRWIVIIEIYCASTQEVDCHHRNVRRINTRGRLLTRLNRTTSRLFKSNVHIWPNCDKRELESCDRQRVQTRHPMRTLAIITCTVLLGLLIVLAVYLPVTCVTELRTHWPARTFTRMQTYIHTRNCYVSKLSSSSRTQGSTRNTTPICTNAHR